MNPPYPKRLIEVDLPIREISAHARREKSIRHGHISTLHIWWARRPLAACRAVLCASLWPDPADEHCPQSFRDAAAKILCEFAEKVRTDGSLAAVCAPHWSRWRHLQQVTSDQNDPAAWVVLRNSLLDFIADFANWDAGTLLSFSDTASRLTAAAGPTGRRPLVIDPFAGGGSIPLEALRVGADASGLEEDARLTAMWLWTLGAGAGASGSAEKDEADEADETEADDDGPRSKGKPLAGFVLEFDAARKIAQGLGAHLDKLDHVVEVKGDKARLLSVAERAKALFGKDAAKDDAPKSKGKGKASKKQLGLFAEIEAAEKEGLLGEGDVPNVGQTTLDRVHQAMLLFGAGRSEALKRFVVEEGVGQDARFWKLGQSLSALYPSGSDEKRWVDGVLARKKGLGF